MRTYFLGLRFGMMLQLAIGPVCLFIMRSSFTLGLGPALLAVAAVALVDAVYMLAASLLSLSLLRQPRVKVAAQVLGGVILVLFGVDTALSAFELSFLPGIQVGNTQGTNTFVYALVLTASSPLTILFWASVFGERVASKGYRPAQLAVFAAGCLSSTLVFLGGISLIGAGLGASVPELVLKILNVGIGAAIVAFGTKLLLRR